MQRIVVKSFPFFRGNADGEIIWIGRGAADHGEDFTGAWIESDHSSGAHAEGLFGDLLQVVVDGELNLLAGNRFLLSKVAELFHFFADAVDDNAAHAVRAGQDVVVLALETGFSGEVAWTEPAIAGFDLLFADFADIPAGVGHEATRKITAALNHQHFKKRDVGAMRLDESHVRAGGFGLDNDGLKLRKIFGAFELILEITDLNAEAVGNSREIFVYESGIVAKKKDTERRIVIDENAAIAIEHAATGSDDGNGANAIALSHLAVFIGVDDLEFPEAEKQQSDHAHDDVGSDGQSGLWQTIVVAKPVRHENPARENLFLLRSSNGRHCYQGDSSPIPREAGTCSRHEKSYRVSFEMSAENFLRKKYSKNSPRDPESLPDYCCSKCCNGSKVIFKRSTWTRGPQAVLKDSCLDNTPMENRRGGAGLAGLVRRGRYGGYHSFIAQSLDRIHLGCSSRRKIAGQQCNQGKKQRCGAENCGVRGAHVEEPRG